jgi:G6PDH family F420-dependent oxidoreductase
MLELGYKISSEEHPPAALVDQARRAESVGFDFAMISDHYHPWVDRQGHSPFVWSVIGAIAQATAKLPIGTAVTCPTIRTHPAIIAQAAATAGCLLPGRFWLGLGSGENLNEHILGTHWPETDVRQEMLAEAVEVIRQLWQGGNQSHRGRYYTVENARVYDLPDQLPPILLAASGPKAAELAGKHGDGLVATGPEAELVKQFERAGGKGKPRYAEIGVCWARDVASARKTAHEWWPTAGLEGELSQELSLPRYFEQAAATVDEESVAKSLVCGPDVQPYVEMVGKYTKAGFDRIWFHQIGPDQEGFFQFAERELLPAVRKLPAARKAA